MTATIAIVVGVLGVGLALSQLFRLRSWLSRPPSPSDAAPEAEPEEPPR